MESKKTIRMLTAALATCAAAWATEPARTLDVCIAAIPDWEVAWRARMVAAQAFATIGVKLRWREAWACPKNVIQVAFSESTPPDLLPGVMAYALPFEGTRIVVFPTRVRDSVEHDKVGCLMGHVVAHEIGHVLEGVDRHSRTGLMKARFTAEDYRKMMAQPMPFAQEDARLIHLGMELRD